MSALSYANAHLNQSIDNGQGGYAGECVSLAIRVMNAEYGVPYGTLYCSNTGGARDLYEQFDGKIPQYFDRIANDPNNWNQLPQEGDLIIWGTYMGKYGHIAVCLTGNPLRVFQQLGTPVFKRSEIVNYPNYNGVLGWLRPKKQSTNNQGGTMDQQQKQFIDQVFADVLERAPDQAAYTHYGSGQYSDRAFILNDVRNSSEARLVKQRRADMAVKAGQVDQLNAVVSQKQNEIVALQGENAELQRKLTAAQSQPQQPSTPTTGNLDLKSVHEKLDAIKADTGSTKSKVMDIFK